MSIHVALNHVTHYRYDRPVNLSPQVIRLRPAPHCRTRILSYSMRVDPVVHFINWQQDPFSNHLARLVFPEQTTEFKITVDLVAEMAVYNPFDFFLEPHAENYPFQYDEASLHDLQPYLAKVEPTPAFKAFLDSIEIPAKDEVRTIDFLVALNQRLQSDISYTRLAVPRGLSERERGWAAAIVRGRRPARGRVGRRSDRLRQARRPDGKPAEHHGQVSLRGGRDRDPREAPLGRNPREL